MTGERVKMLSLARTGSLLVVAISCFMIAGPAVAQSSFEDVDGSFIPATTFPVGTAPFSVAIGDFNGDGNQDIAVGNEGSDKVSILLGTGAGGFGAAIDYPAGDGPQTVAIADFNGDGNQDLAVANLWSNNVSILMGTRTGAFGAATNFAVGINPRSVAIADFNGDGRPDLVVPNGSSGNISVLLGTGNGGFGAAASYAVGGGAISVAIGYFNGDAFRDLAVVNEQSSSVSILLGTGSGSFGTASNLPVGIAPRSVTAGDFNSDGRLDLAVAKIGGGYIELLFGAGDGTFFEPSLSPQFKRSDNMQATFVSTGDLNGDGKLELVVANLASGRVSIHLGLDDGRFGSPTRFNTFGQDPRGIAIGDLNNDGKPDLAVVNQASNTISILIGETLPVLNVQPIANIDATSSYTLRKSSIWVERQVPGTDLFSHAMYADINKDGFVDFVRTMANNDGTRRPLRVMMGGSGGTFTDQTTTVIATQPGLQVPRKILTTDFNGDAWPDFFVLAHGIDFAIPAPGEYPQLFLSNANGTLRYAGGLEGQQFVGFNHGGAAADIDNNGTLDVLVANPAQPYFLINDGAGNFTKNTNRLSPGLSGRPLFTAELIDVDKDGFIDLVAGGHEFEGMETVIYWGSSLGYYRQHNRTILPPVSGWGIALDFAAEDLDLDGRKDLIVNRTRSAPFYEGRYLQILRQTAPRTFVDETASRMFMNTSLRVFDFFRAQDINGDGAIDLFVDDKSDISTGEYAWRNNGNGVFTPYAGVVAPAMSTKAPSSFNGDSRSDVFWRNTRTGANTIWKSGNAATLQATRGVTDPNWKVVGVGDFNGDGKSDVFWRNTRTGANTIWKSGNAATLQATMGVTDHNWKVVGVGDFNGDGKSDVFWRNTRTGANTIWKSGNAATLQVTVGVTDQNWRVVGVGDFNGDGKSDVFWRNTRTGANTIWKSGDAAKSRATVGVTDQNWKVLGVGDFNGDGKSDVFWRNTSTGANTIWKSAIASTQQAAVGLTSQNWKVVAVGDFNGDGKSDVFWRHIRTGANTIWKSGNPATSHATAGVSNLAWVVVPRAWE